STMATMPSSSGAASDFFNSLLGLSAGVRPLLSKRNNNGNRGSNSSVPADNTPRADSTPGRVGSSRTSRTGNNTDYSRGSRARSRGQKLRARSRRQHQG